MRTPYVGGLVLLMAGCSSMGINTKYDPQAAFRDYKTYSWAAKDQGCEGSSVQRSEDRMQDQLIETLFDQEFSRRGFSRVEKGQSPDLLVSFWTMTRDRVDFKATSRPDSLWNSGQESQTYRYLQGTLSVEFTDTKTGRPVWNGVAIDAVGDTGPSQKQLAHAVESLMQKYPDVTRKG